MIRFMMFKNTVLLFVFLVISCGNGNPKQSAALEDSTEKTAANLDVETSKVTNNSKQLVVGANQTALYLPLLEGKKVGIVANQTSVLFKDKTEALQTTNYTHLVDSLVALNVTVSKVFAPEHGFRGTADAGEVVKDGIDTKTGLPIISLYGKNKKPTAKQLQGLEVMIFDIQDVGVRFYTYISTLHYIMEACAEQNIPLIILDRPNPNGHYIDGPVLELEHKSFVGMHPVPVVHGMTIGEYAQMINGEKWLKNKVQCDITVIPVKNYTHNTFYSLPIQPSPNLPNDVAINLYPSLCFFEGTNVSAGRGTDKQFQVFGSPFLNTEMYNFNYTFTPQPNIGAKYPKHEGKLCYGLDLSETQRLNRLDLNYVIDAYNSTENKDEFFNDFFTKLAGTKSLQQQIEGKHTAYELKKNWVRGIEDYKLKRKAYLLYD
ncbi:exo-beta-N-acetylmuramidase NamZ family protein [Lacinutrix salivirga]